MEKPSLHLGYEDRVVETTCPYCGVGCTLALRIRDGRVIGAGAGVPGSVNGYNLCVKGRFGLDFVHHPDRLKKPLLRKNGERRGWDFRSFGGPWTWRPPRYRERPRL
ncbi:MAG: hypothetical protein H5T74_14410 [Actinobacteria bacterium]|nr:hypothetical protein [Actinomycetota bacterium]